MINNNYSKEQFIKDFPEFVSIFTASNNGIFDNMFATLIELGDRIFDKTYYQEMSERCLGYWLAHNMQLAISRTKNINNSTNLNTENPDANVSQSIGSNGQKIISDFQREYSQTPYGQILYPIMKTIGKWKIRGVY